MQAVALFIFAYQMIVALDKYATFSSVPTEETKDIADAKLPDIYLCMVVKTSSQILMKHGYSKWLSMTNYLSGTTMESGKRTYVTWEGIHNQSYEKIIGKNVKKKFVLFLVFKNIYI